MNLRIEAIIDIDPRRRAIIAGNVEDVDSKEFRNVAHALSQAVTEKALLAASVGAEGIEPDGASIAKAAGADPLAPSQRKPRPEDPASMRTFGEEDDQTDAD